LVPFLLANNVRFAWGDKEKRLRNFLLAKRREKIAARDRRVEQERLEAERRERDEAEAAATAAAAAEQQRLDDEAAATAAARDQRWMDEPAVEEQKDEDDAQFDAEWERATEEARLAEEAAAAEQQRQYDADAASLDHFMEEQNALNAAEEARYQERLRLQEIERRQQEQLDAFLAAQVAANERVLSELSSKIDKVQTQPVPSSTPVTLNDISALFQKKIDELNISNLSAVGTPDMVTHSDLRQTLDRRDENLKSYFTATIDEKHATIKSKLDAILASTTSPSARRNLSEEPAFQGHRVNIDPHNIIPTVDSPAVAPIMGGTIRPILTPTMKRTRNMRVLHPNALHVHHQRVHMSRDTCWVSPL
jgi:hypothetical protein